MSRLIDADAFRRELDNHWPFTKEGQREYVIADMAKSTLLVVLNNMPTIDAVQVVRCKDCKYFDSEDDCDCPMDVRYSDFFCKMGERRTDEEIIHQYHERHKEVLKEMSMPVGRSVIDALRERRTDETD